MFSYRECFSLQNKRIIVSGACGLLGQEICLALAELGAQVVLVDINQLAAEEQAHFLWKQYGAKASVYPINISDEELVQELMKYLQTNDGTIDALVNSAYPRNSAWGTKFEDIQLNSWRENVDMHMNGYFYICQQAAKVMMRQDFGNIINLASIYGMLGPDFRIYAGTSMTMPAEYAAIKGGIINFTRYLATYLAPYKIRVNSISAGGIYDGQPQEFVDKYCLRTPLGRMGTPADIAGGVLYLLSDLSGYVTGQNMIIDGGWSTW
ncbi:MAG: oxidoreductase [Syntrophomonadaceae bacterium]|nr:oxidoreductase [Syntrophomonadaceae bacterium]